MPHFAANLSMMFTEHPFMERFDAAAVAGFEAVEFLFPYAHSAVEIRGALDRNGLDLALFNAPPGDWDAGERGTAALAGRAAFACIGPTTAEALRARSVEPQVVSERQSGDDLLDALERHFAEEMHGLS